MEKPEDVMFSPAVKVEQTRLGSREAFEDRDWQTEITDDLRQFLAAIDTFFLATASADGRPYIQHRGGPAGFLKPIGSHINPSSAASAIAPSCAVASAAPVCQRVFNPHASITSSTPMGEKPMKVCILPG